VLDGSRARSRDRRPAAAAGLLGLAAAAYILAAWASQPGFFDGFAPPQPYRWVSAPQQFLSSNQPPLSAHQTVTSQPGVLTLGAGTDDRQAQLLFGPGAFAGSDRVVVDIVPVARYPRTAGIDPSTNVYLIKSSAPLSVEASVRLGFSELSRTGKLYRADYPDGRWQAIGSTDPKGLPYFVGTVTRLPAYFVGGSPAVVRRPGSQQGPALQLVVLAAILLVVLGALPVLLLRRRS
jgi:hypothetical protein